MESKSEGLYVYSSVLSDLKKCINQQVKSQHSKKVDKAFASVHKIKPPEKQIRLNRNNGMVWKWI